MDDIFKGIEMFKDIILANKYFVMGFVLLWLTQWTKEFLGKQLKIKLIKDQVLIVPFIYSTLFTAIFILIEILPLISLLDGFGGMALISMGGYKLGSSWTKTKKWFLSTWEINGGTNRRRK